jgi:tRNA pseudouridine38-40 synthase
VVTRRFAATVRYDGTEFSGSQLQPGARTVQAELEKAALALFGAPVRVALAGRTDAGVHARGQVMAFSVDSALDEATVGRALNALLPADVAVASVRSVEPGFDPRRQALRRHYRYTIATGAVRDPLRRRTSWHVTGPLDLAAMAGAAGRLPGTRDFSACSGPIPEGRTAVRRVSRAEWSTEGCDIRFDIEGNAFLPQMVRRLTGAFVRVGRGAMTEEEFARRLDEALPGSIGPVAPPQGLVLVRVWYGEETGDEHDNSW